MQTRIISVTKILFPRGQNYILNQDLKIMKSYKFNNGIFVMNQSFLDLQLPSWRWGTFFVCVPEKSMLQGSSSLQGLSC